MTDEKVMLESEEERFAKLHKELDILFALTYASIVLIENDLILPPEVKEGIDNAHTALRKEMIRELTDI